MMKTRTKTNTVIAVLGALLALCMLGMAQTTDEKKTVAQVLDGPIKVVEGELVPAAEAMPEDKYDFAPTSGEFKGVRTFAQQVGDDGSSETGIRLVRLAHNAGAVVRRGAHQAGIKELKFEPARDGGRHIRSFEVAVAEGLRMSEGTR